MKRIFTGQDYTTARHGHIRVTDAAGEHSWNSVQRVARLLEQQVLDCGHRSSGTPGSERLIRFLTKYFEDLGLRTAIDTFPIDTIRTHRSALDVCGRSFRTLPYYGCPAFLNYAQQ